MDSPKLSAKITPGIINIPGRDPQTQAVAESLLEQDRQKHHCFFNPQGFHNHLSHHLLAAYDLGAPGALLQAIYDTASQTQKPIDGENGTPEQVKITPDNFTEYLGQERYYHAFLTFFTAQIKESGASETIENYVFSPAVNVGGVQMLSRFMGGVYHPLIQTGYGAEFGSDAMIAQGLAQAAMHSPLLSDLLDQCVFDTVKDAANTTIGNEGSMGKPLFHLLRELYDSDALKPVSYDPDKNIAQYRAETMKDGRPEEIKKLCATWWGNTSLENQASGIDARVEELFWTTTLLFCGTGKRGRKPRLDFLLVHAMNATLFLPSLLRIIPSSTSRVILLKAFLLVTMLYILVRGRPRIDVGLAMSYTATPRPPGQQATPSPSPHAIGNPSEMYNPWFSICASVLHAPDAHTVKAVRALLHAAQNYGHKKGRDVPGCFIMIDKERREETFPGMTELDGTVFVRAAGVLMNTLGWATQSSDDKPGGWDFSGLGWDDAWKQ